MTRYGVHGWITTTRNPLARTAGRLRRNGHDHDPRNDHETLLLHRPRHRETARQNMPANCAAAPAGHGRRPTASGACNSNSPHPERAARRQFRRSGFRTAATTPRTMLDEVRALLALAPKDRDLTLRIAQLLYELPARSTRSPRPQAVVRKLRAGPVDGVTTTLAATTSTTGSPPGPGSRPARSTPTPTTSATTSHPTSATLASTNSNPIHIQDMFTEIEASNQQIRTARASTRPGRPSDRRMACVLSATTTKQRIRATLRKALTDAIKIYRLIDYNPAVPIDLPPAVRPRARAWNAKAVANWKATGEVPEPGDGVATRTGQHVPRLRRRPTTSSATPSTHWSPSGDSAAAKPADCATSTSTSTPATITIIQQRTAVGYQPIVKDVKSPPGSGVLASTPTRSRSCAPTSPCAPAGNSPADPSGPAPDTCSSCPDGQPWHPDQLTDRFERTIRDAGLPPIRFHDLRHCAASYLKLAAPT